MVEILQNDKMAIKAKLCPSTEGVFEEITLSQIIVSNNTNETIMEIYQQGELNEFETSISNNGQLVPIIVTNDYCIIDGLLRYKILEKQGFEKIKVQKMEFDSSHVDQMLHLRLSLNHLRSNTTIKQRVYDILSYLELNNINISRGGDMKSGDRVIETNKISKIIEEFGIKKSSYYDYKKYYEIVKKSRELQGKTVNDIIKNYDIDSENDKVFKKVIVKNYSETELNKNIIVLDEIKYSEKELKTIFYEKYASSSSKPIWEDVLAIDISRKNDFRFMINKYDTLIASRNHWVDRYGNYLSIDKLMEIQGFPEDFKFKVKSNFRQEIVKMLGNSVVGQVSKYIFEKYLEPNYFQSYVCLFSGAGGFGLNFENLTCKLAVEFDTLAAETFKVNHNPKIMLNQDIKTINFDIYKRKVGELDVIIGSPSCQSYSVANIERREDDDRNKLYLEYLRAVKTFSPKMFVLENVVQFAESKDYADFVMIANKLGYEIQSEIINSFGIYGCKQNRERLFVIGKKKNLFLLGGEN